VTGFGARHRGRPGGRGISLDVPFGAMGTADELIERLGEIATRLGDPGVGAEEAERLAREAADLVARASSEIESALRAAREGERR
jgi:hypothetical protein